MDAELTAQVHAIANPAIADAERELTRQPHRIDLPGVIKWSNPIRSVLTAHEKAWDEWSEVNNELAEKLQDLIDGRENESAAMLRAARKGDKRPPQTADLENTAKDVQWAYARTRAKREEADRIASEMDLDQMIGHELDTYIEQLRQQIETAETVLGSYVRAFADQYTEARAHALRVNQAVDYFRPHIARRYGVSSTGSVFDPIPEIQVPHARELKLTRAANLLAMIDNVRDNTAAKERREKVSAYPELADPPTDEN